MKIETVGFVGLGLIGGSIAKAIKAFHPEIQIMAYMRSTDTLIEAANEGTVDMACTAVDTQFSACDCIFLCAPVSTNAMYLEKLKPILKKGAILTDVGSTKTDIHEKAAALGLEDCFIGGHPMAGSEKTGYSNAKPHLIENAYYVITPAARVPADAVETFVSFTDSLKALPLVMDHRQHDFITASISHLPHLIASSLVNLVRDLDGEEKLMKRIAAGGFKDITRIASSSPDMWESICMSNTENIANLLDDYIVSLQTISSAVRAKQNGFTYDLFAASKEYRDSFSDLPRGPITKVFACYVDIPDEAGAIASIASLLAQAGISIKNIGIIHNRDFEEGVLRVEFYEQTALNEAVTLLRSLHYSIYHRK